MEFIVIAIQGLACLVFGLFVIKIVDWSFDIMGF